MAGVALPGGAAAGAEEVRNTLCQRHPLGGCCAAVASVCGTYLYMLDIAGYFCVPVCSVHLQAKPAEEKTEFDVKLVAHEDKAKIKVIKEVRNILPDLKLAEVRLLSTTRGILQQWRQVWMVAAVSVEKAAES